MSLKKNDLKKDKPYFCYWVVSYTIKYSMLLKLHTEFTYF